MASPTNTSAWRALQSHSELFKQPAFRMSQLFATTSDRFNTFSLQQENILLDFSKNFITEETRGLLLDLARQQQLPAAIEAMFAGDTVNNTEQRQALHIALRAPEAPAQVPEVAAALSQMDALVHAVHAGDWTGFSGKAITDVVNLGVGGSDLGPALAVSALQHTASTPIRMHFVSNIDPLEITSTLDRLKPESTLFIVASKTFSTLETLHNARVARQWLVSHAGNEQAVNHHFVAVTSNIEAACKFGINTANILPMWDWVGGRFSLWSAIGLPVALALGMDQFRQLLAGAHAMDQHFRTAPLGQNMPVILALLTIWYRGFFNAHSSAVVPYAQALELLPAYLQQLSMESLGKGVDRNNEAVTINTGEPVWGVVGTDVQHSCFQLLHQGTEFIPVDFIVSARPATTSDLTAHQQLLANCFSQSLALMQGHHDADTEKFAVVPGNKPSTTVMLMDINAYNLGSLLAMYEHKIYAQSVVWDINAFDQWGVELGKRLSKDIYDSISNPDSSGQLDDSTENLIRCATHWNN